jgi:hypothetical protein
MDRNAGTTAAEANAWDEFANEYLNEFGGTAAFLVVLDETYVRQAWYVGDGVGEEHARAAAEHLTEGRPAEPRHSRASGPLTDASA